MERILFGYCYTQVLLLLLYEYDFMKISILLIIMISRFHVGTTALRGGGAA